MIVQIKNKLYDSMNETICIQLTNRELAMITHNYITKNSPETILVLNGKRKDTSMKDALLTTADAKQFIKRLEKYLLKKYPEKYKSINSVEVA